MSTNPLIGSTWGQSPDASGNTLNTQGATPPPNSLTPWLGAAPAPPGAGSSPLPQTSPIATPNNGTFGNPANLPNPGSNSKDNTRNAGFENVITGQLRNQLIPMFANLMTGYAGPAANFFNTLMNLGGPYYQQKQALGTTQGIQQNQNAGAQAKQQLASAGYGFTPSGAEAGMIGGMAQSGANNLATNFLQQLFQNENLQMGGAQGLQSIASMFNPSGLTSGEVATPGSTQGPSASQQLAQIMGSLFGSGGISGGSGGSSGGSGGSSGGSGGN